MNDLETMLKQATADLEALQSEKAQLPNRITELTAGGQLATADDLADLINRRQVLPNLITAAEINQKRFKIMLLEQEAATLRERVPQARAAISEAEKQVETAKDNLKAVRKQWSGPETDLRWAKNELARQKRELEALVFEQNKPQGRIVRDLRFPADD